MKLTAVSAALAASVVFASSAQARTHHHYHYRHHHDGVVAYHRYHHTVVAYRRHHRAVVAREEFGGVMHYQAARSADGYGARPSAWCGWEMRHLVGRDPGTEYNLARNWAHWGRSGPAGVGAVVVWSHHVGKIVGQENGHWVVESGNDGHALRTRPRSIAGAIAIRWG